MTKISKVVVPVDFSSHTDKVVEYALSVADEFGAEVLFLHVVNDYLVPARKPDSMISRVAISVFS